MCDMIKTNVGVNFSMNISTDRIQLQKLLHEKGAQHILN